MEILWKDGIENAVTDVSRPLTELNEGSVSNRPFAEFRGTFGSL